MLDPRFSRRGFLGLAGATVGAFALVPTAFAAEAFKPMAEDGSFDRIVSAGSVTFGTSNDQPFSFLDAATGEITGIDAEMLLAMLQKLGIGKHEIVQVGFDGLIPGLMASRMDMIADGMYITEKRQKVVDFSNPWYQYGESLVVLKGNPKKLYALSDLTPETKTGAPLGTVYLDWLNEITPLPQVSSYPDAAALLADLKIGRIDAALIDAPVAGYAMRTNPDYAEAFEMVSDYTPKEVGRIGSAFRKEDGALREAFNFALDALKKDGTDLEILKKWGLGEVNRVPVSN